MRYLVVYERSGTGYSAYLPDLPGCVAAGDTRQEVARLIREAVAFHLEGLREHGYRVPESAAWAEVVEI